MPRLPHPRTALSGYADARLPAWRRVVVRRHLRGCTRCAVEVAQIRALGDLLRAPPAPGPSRAFVEELLALGGEARVDVPGRAADRAGRPHDRAGAGAAGVLVAAVLVLGSVAAGASVTGVSVPWPASTRASMSSLLPRLLPGTAEPGGAVPVREVDNGQRP